MLLEPLRDYPTAAVVGPRQCGKTTLAKSLGGGYFDLEQEPERLRLDLEWPELVRGKRREGRRGRGVYVRILIRVSAS